MKKRNYGHIPEILYSRIINAMPIPCVDLVVSNSKGKILMLKRKNSPAKDEWWFPGGRVHFMEKRYKAALRKLKDECGLTGKIIKEVGTFDLILEKQKPSHGITTVYLIKTGSSKIHLDVQSAGYAWMKKEDIEAGKHHEFVKKVLNAVIIL